MQTLAEDKTLVVQLAAPTNLRVTKDTAECATHYGSGFASLLAGLVCGELIAPPGGVSKFDVLIWEWDTGILSCFPQPDEICFTVEEPDGYYLYRIPILLLEGYIIEIPDNLAPYKHIPNPDQRVVAVPLPWPPDQKHVSWCYGVAVYKEILGTEKQVYAKNLLCYGINYP